MNMKLTFGFGRVAAFAPTASAGRFGKDRIEGVSGEVEIAEEAGR